MILLSYSQINCIYLLENKTINFRTILLIAQYDNKNNIVPYIL